MEMISVALPKGRLGEKVYAQFKAAGSHETLFSANWQMRERF